MLHTCNYVYFTDTPYTIIFCAFVACSMVVMVRHPVALRGFCVWYHIAWDIIKPMVSLYGRSMPGMSILALLIDGGEDYFRNTNTKGKSANHS